MRSKDIYKFVIVGKSGSVVFKKGHKPYYDTRAEAEFNLEKLNKIEGPGSYLIGAASLSSLESCLVDGPMGEYYIPTVDNNNLPDAAKAGKIDDNKFIILNQENGCLVFKPGFNTYYDAKEEIEHDVDSLNRIEGTKKYIVGILSLKDLLPYLSKTPGEYPICTTTVDGVTPSQPEIKGDIEMAKKITHKYAIVDLNGSIVFKYGIRPYYDNRTEAEMQIDRLNHAEGKTMYRVGVVDAENLAGYMSQQPEVDGMTGFPPPGYDPTIGRSTHFNGRPYPDPLGNMNMRNQSFQAVMPVPTMQQPIYPHNIFPLTKDWGFTFINHTDWELIKEIGEDSTGENLIVEVKIKGKNEIKTVSKKEVNHITGASFIVAIFDSPNGDVMAVNPLFSQAKTLPFKAGYKIDYFSDGTFQISEPYSNFDELFKEMFPETGKQPNAGLGFTPYYPGFGQ